jgi:hypothetical protein
LGELCIRNHLKIIDITGKISYINTGADSVVADNFLINKATTDLSERIPFLGVSLLVAGILTDLYKMRRAILSVKYRLTF